MKRIVLNYFAGLAVLLPILLSTGCDKDNDFYFAGRQPVTLLEPINDSVMALDYTNPEKITTFKWQSKRPYMDVNVKFGLDKEFTGKTELKSAGIATGYSIAAVRLDSLLAALDVSIGATVTLYWTIDVKDPEFGWCDEVRSVIVTRFDIPDNVILLTSPSDNATVNLDRTQPEALCNFTWESGAKISNYRFAMYSSPTVSSAAKIVERDMGSAKLLAFMHFSLDSLLEKQELDRGESIDLYWQVTAEGDNTNPVVNSGVHKVTVKRFAHEPYPVEITAPAGDEEIVLETSKATEEMTFAWNCEGTDITYSLKLYDTELGKEKVYGSISDKFFKITRQDFDDLLERTFEMVPAQRKKLYMVVTPSDLNEAVPDSVQFWVKRFPAGGGAPISIVSAPADGTAYTLNYADASTELASVIWNFSGSTTFAIEYSLNADMSDSKKKTLTTGTTLSMTHQLLDDMLSDLVGGYLTRDVYWRITSNTLGAATPSETRKLTLTGMLRPLVDNRDAANPQTYPVVKIGDDFWMGENLRATQYADGTALAVAPQDAVPSAQFLIDNPQFNDAEYTRLAGKYYAWNVATRITWNEAKTATLANEEVQGVCPDGWHLPSYAEVVTMRTSSEVGEWSGEKIKHPTYWAVQDGTNTTGLGIVQSLWYTAYDGSELQSTITTGFLWTSSPSIIGTAKGWNEAGDVDDPLYAVALMLERGAGNIMFRGVPINTIESGSYRNFTVPCRCIKDR